jgi:type VI secretion system protein ImpH
MKDLLFNAAYSFEFFQAVRLLERLYPHREPVGRTAHPSREVVRFGAHLSLSFPASQLYEVEPGKGGGAPEDGQPRMTVNFMGLTGPLGVLPRPYTELLLERVKQKDFTLRDFLDLFNHRLISLFYRAWEKYRLPIAYERGAGDDFTRYLSSLVGIGTPGLQGRSGVRDEALLYYAGLFNQRPSSASALQALLRDHFEVPVEIVQFQGDWFRLEPENLTRLGTQNYQLGSSAIIGDRVWDRQAKFRIRMGPLELGGFRGLLPLEKGFSELSELTRLFVGLEYDFDVQLVLKARQVPACQLVTRDEGGPRLGWSAWLKTQTFTQDVEDTVLSCNN